MQESKLLKYIDVPLADLNQALSHISPKDRQILIAAIAKLKAKRSPLDFMEVASGGTVGRPKHLEVINQVLVKATTEQMFVVISVPVRHGKSFLASEYFPAWYMSRYPDNKLLMASYNLDTSTNFTSKARDNFVDNQDLFDMEIDKYNSSKSLWSIQGHRNGSVKATGVGASIIGYGGHMIICDDMYKDVEQAYSKSYNNKLKEWWSAVLRHRLEPSGSMILVLARWAEDDLAGWLVNRIKEDPDASKFVEIKLPAIAMEDCQITGRKAGDLLWPERYDERALRALKADVGEMIWACQFQQQPVSVQNSMFKPDNWRFYPEYTTTEDGVGRYMIARDMKWVHSVSEKIPNGISLVRYWDLTAGGKYSDYLVGALLATDGSGLTYILDIVRQKYAGEDAEKQIEQTLKSVAEADQARYQGKVKIFIEEVGGIGKTTVKNYVDVTLKGFNVKSDKTQGKKETRAMPLASDQQQNNVFIVLNRTPGGYEKKPWTEAFIDELAHCSLSGITSKHDDQIDAAAGAYNKLVVDKAGRAGSIYSGKTLTTALNNHHNSNTKGAGTGAGGRGAAIQQIRRGSSNQNVNRRKAALTRLRDK